jgi:hypothetical protein
VPISYYSDEMRGQRPRQHEELTSDVWGGIVALYMQGIGRAWFGKDFPEQCEDREGVCGCDERTLRLALKAEIPDLDLPLRQEAMPPTLAALDLLQFMFEHTSAPRERRYHEFLGHHHLTFNVDKGRIEMRERINRLLARGGMAYELDEEGRIEHLASPALEEQLARELPATDDETFDELLQSAIDKFRSADVRVRGEALEPLWDAFERAKTMLHRDKKRGFKALVSAATEGADPREADLLEEEMRQLTAIGNGFRIRHHETTKAEISDELAEQLFARMFALLYRVHDCLVDG